MFVSPETNGTSASRFVVEHHVNIAVGCPLKVLTWALTSAFVNFADTGRCRYMAGDIEAVTDLVRSGQVVKAAMPDGEDTGPLY